MSRKTHIMASIAALTLTAWVAGPDVSGEDGRSIHYQGQLESVGEQGPCEFSIEIEPVSFALNAFESKYKLLRVRVENNRAEALSLSSENDTLELVVDDDGSTRRVRGIFDLQAADPDLWDALDIEMREVLAYPQAIRAAREPERRRGGVVRYVYAFFPREQVVATPVRFELDLASLDRSISIERPRPMRR